MLDYEVAVTSAFRNDSGLFHVVAKTSACWNNSCLAGVVTLT